MSDRIQVIICSVLFFAISAWAYYFQFEYPALLDEFDFNPAQVWEEPWRLITSHFLHLTQLHWLLNGVGLVAVTVFFANYFNVRTYLNALVVVAIGSAIAIELVGFEGHFVGLSIINHGLLIMGLLLELQATTSETQRKIVFSALVLLAAKWLAEVAGIWESVLAVGQVQHTWQLHGVGILFGILAWWLHNRRLAKLAQLESD